MIQTFHTLKNKLIKYCTFLCLMTGGLFLGLIVSEILIRICNPQPFSVKISLPNFDTKTGIPNKEYKPGEEINSFGFHDSEHDIGEHPGIFRIVVLGDSFTQAMGVPLEDTWCKQLQTVLQRSTGKKIEIINLGIGGAGTGWEALILEKLGVRYKPDLTLVLFHLGSDFFNNNIHMENKFEKPFFKIHDGKISLIDNAELEIYIRKIYTPLWRISHLYRYLHRSIYKIKKFGEFNNKMPDLFNQYLAAPSSWFWKESESCTLVYLKKIQDLSKINSSSLIVVSVPDKYLIYDDCLNGLKSQWSELQNIKKYNINAPLGHLNRILKKLNISFIDMTPFIKKKSLYMGKLYFEKDIHWNSLGNKAVAEILSEQLMPFLN